MSDRCGAPMRYHGHACARPSGHKGQHYSEAALKARLAFSRDYGREYRQKPEATESERERGRSPGRKAYQREYLREYRQRPEVKAAKREYDQMPEAVAARHRRREREANSKVFYSTGGLIWRDECYICHGPLGDKPHRDHVIALAEEPHEGVTISGLRWACQRCNTSRGAKPLAQFLLERLRAA